jgi:hypothetical protein
MNPLELLTQLAAVLAPLSPNSVFAHVFVPQKMYDSLRAQYSLAEETDETPNERGEVELVKSLQFRVGDYELFIVAGDDDIDQRILTLDLEEGTRHA